jgi:NADPH2:quinone reductase
VGFTGGRPALAKTNHLLVKDASVIGFTLGGLQRHKPALAAHQSSVLLDWLASGRLKPFISHRLAMDDVIEAYQLIKDRQIAGKVILTSNQDDF